MGISIYVGQHDSLLGVSDAIGFFGDAGFGAPIALNSFNGRTFITNSSGITQGIEIDNCKLLKTGDWDSGNGPSGVIVGQSGSGIGILYLPNFLATMNIRFTNVSPVAVQNASILVHDGSGINGPSGLNVYMAELIHPTTLQTDLGTGDSAWILVSGLGYELGLSNSPGTSGSFPVGGQDARHDWYVAVSVEPTRPGNKTYSYTVSMDYI